MATRPIFTTRRQTVLRGKRRPTWKCNRRGVHHKIHSSSPCTHRVVTNLADTSSILRLYLCITWVIPGRRWRSRMRARRGCKKPEHVRRPPLWCRQGGLAMASSLRAASHRVPVSASAAALPRTPFSRHSAPVRSPFKHPRVWIGGVRNELLRRGLSSARSGSSSCSGASSFGGLGGVAAAGRNSVSTAAMAENLKDLHLDDGAVADKVRCS